tara:strand:+ start:839 stop:1069 length:231 start_codon:yes stop_codon:yes gene_type:complete
MSEQPRCGKIIYPNATMVHHAMRDKAAGCECKPGVKLRYYYCDICEGYHLTKMTTPQTKAFKKAQKEAWQDRKVKP